MPPSAYLLVPPSLRLLVVLLVAVVMASPPPAEAVSCPNGPIKVVIVGAGISGAAAAQNLTASSACFQVTVLDGRPRVGGRMFSKRGHVEGLGSVLAEMGAQWIHGPEGNPIYALAKKFGLGSGPLNGMELQFTAEGQEYSNEEQDAAWAQYDALKKRAQRIIDNSDADISVDAAFRKANETLYLTPFVQAQVVVDFEFDYGSLNDLSGRYYDDDKSFDGEDVLPLGGYDTIPKSLMSEAQAAGASLRLNFIVYNITVNADGGVTLLGMNSSGGPLEPYDADYVILTVPLGILKAGSITFRPPLSSKKQGAIDRLGWSKGGTKVSLFYRTPYWDVSADEYGIEDDDVPADRGKFPYWRNLVRLENFNGLIGYALGGYAKRMKGNYTWLVTDARTKITMMFPQARNVMNKPLCYWVKDWGWDPLAQGIYSYFALGTQVSDYDTMALPEGPILFAGEHTIGDYRATVHGAYLSGIREARRLLVKADAAG